MCNIFFKFYYFFFLFGQSGDAYRWRVCYQRGLPRLVLFYHLFQSCLHLFPSHHPIETTTQELASLPGNNISIEIGMGLKSKLEEEKNFYALNILVLWASLV